MGAAALPHLRKGGAEAKSYAASEGRKLAETLRMIAEGVKARKITPERAALLLDMQRHASKAVLLAVEGIGILAAERAVNAALGAAKAAVNRVVGFGLIG
jgi:hypothetical protein